MILRVAAAALAALTLLAACGRPATAPAAARAAAAPAAAGAKLTPEQAREKATKQARAWNAGAELVGVAWAVPKLELGAITYHVFRADGVEAVLAVETRLTTFWQQAHVLGDKRLAIAARALDPLGRPAIDARRALAIAKAARPAAAEDLLAAAAIAAGGREDKPLFTPALTPDGREDKPLFTPAFTPDGRDDKPLALLVLADARLAPPVWGAQAGAKRVLIHAETGQVLLGGGSALDVVTDAIRQVPAAE